MECTLNMPEITRGEENRQGRVPRERTAATSLILPLFSRLCETFYSFLLSLTLKRGPAPLLKGPKMATDCTPESVQIHQNASLIYKAFLQNVSLLFTKTASSTAAALKFKQKKKESFSKGQP